MLIAQDLILVASDADRTGLTCFASDASHRTCSGFASDADRTGLQLGSPRMLIAQDLILFIRLGLHLWCQFFEDFDPSDIISFLPEGLFETFIRCETPLYSAFLFQIWNHISDAICHAMYDCAWVKCLCIGFTFMFFSFYQICHLLAHAYFAGLLVQSLSRRPWEIFLSRYLLVASYLTFRFWKQDILVQTFKYETQEFSSDRKSVV